MVFAGPVPAGWHRGLPGITVETEGERHVRLAAGDGADPAAVLRAARAVGDLLRFGFEPPSLTELFQEAIGR